MLADDDRPFLAFFQVFRQQQDATGNDVAINVQHDFVTGELLLVEDQPRSWIEWHGRLRQTADHFVVDPVPQPVAGLEPLFDRRIVGFPFRVANLRAQTQQILHVYLQFVELPLLPRGVIVRQD